MPKQIAVSYSEFRKYGCIKCGCTFTHSNMSSGGTTPVTCGGCNEFFVLLADGLKESHIVFGKEGYKPTLIEHPRKGLWPHDFVRPDIRPKGVDGEFWSPRGVGYDLAGFVQSKEAGERILQMIKDLIEEEPKSWLDYRPKEPMWIQVKIQKEDGFHLETLNNLCKDGVINKHKLALCLIFN